MHGGDPACAWRVGDRSCRDAKGESENGYCKSGSRKEVDEKQTKKTDLKEEKTSKDDSKKEPETKDAAKETTEVKKEEKQKASQPDTSAPAQKNDAPQTTADRMQVIQEVAEIKMQLRYIPIITIFRSIHSNG